MPRIEFRSRSEAPYPFREKVALWVAFRLPRVVVYWAAIRLATHATSGPWSDEEVSRLRFMDALDRWRRPNG